MTTLQQGPGLMPRNWLADQLRGYGLNQLADRANSPTSGLGILADGVGGVANLLMQPVTSFQEMLANPYQRGGTDDRFVGNAFDVAGGAMTGGLLAPRPKGSVGMGGRPAQAAEPATGAPFSGTAYHGSPDNRFITDPAGVNRSPGEGGPWMSSSPAVASTYALDDLALQPNGSMVVPADVRFRNPMVFDARGAAGSELSGVYPPGHPLAKYAADTTDLSVMAEKGGHDGLVVRNVRDEARGGGQVSDVYHPLQRGTVYSPLTGELLYAGGRPGAAAGAAVNALADNQPTGIRAYHGSPYDFDRFDMSKIGTGEGAQAYGHGLYFAESEGVARSYRDALAPKLNIGGSAMSHGPSAADAVEAAAAKAGAPLEVQDRLRWYVNRGYSADDALKDVSQNFPEWHAKIADVLKPETNAGRMYEVRINANPDDFLDWDKPLSQQSERVRTALQNLGRLPDAAAIRQEIADLEQAARLATTIEAGGQRIFHAGKAAEYRNSPEAARLETARKRLEAAQAAETQSRTPRDLSEAMGYTTDRVGMTNELLSQGIPGIRYLDQGSRGAGEGSRNYVVFDDNLIEILRTYGLAGLLGAGGAVNNLLGSYGYDSPGQPQPPADWTRNLRPGDI